MHVSNQLRSFQYLGGKFSYLPWLLPLLPECKHYVDVFGGSGVVLLNRKRAQIETFNDINGRVVNFFQVLRDQPEDLIRVLQLTPHSRQEYDEAWYHELDSPIESARKFFVRTNQSIWASGGQTQKKGWCVSIKETRTHLSEKTHKWLTAIEGLPAMVERLRGVQIDNRDFRYILKRYDTPETLFYLDSPYEQSLRSSTAYEFDFINQDFFDLHHFSARAVGKVAISGYRTPFMMDLFKDFNLHEGPLRKNNRSEKQAFECLWTNY